MLILTRRVGETLCIGDEEKVTVLGVRCFSHTLLVISPKHAGTQELRYSIAGT